MRFQLALIAVVFFAGSCLLADAPTTAPTTGPTTAPMALTWDQAKSHIGATAIVTGPVVGTHALGSTAAVLNIGKDYPAQDRFTVYLTAPVRAALPADLDQGKTISVTGAIKLFHSVPEIQPVTVTDIVVVESPATQP